MTVQKKRGRKPSTIERRQCRWFVPASLYDLIASEAEAKLSTPTAIVVERLLRDLQAHPFKPGRPATPEDSPRPAKD